jgi:CRP-like cAMP-binding protein
MSVQLEPLTEYFKSQNVTRVFEKGEVIISQGDSPEQLYMVKSGMVKVYDIDVSGCERTITIFSEEHVFPIIWLLNELPDSHLFFYEAYTDVACYSSSIIGARRYMSLHPEILHEANDRLAKAYINMAGRIQNLEKSRMQERLEFVLYFLAVNLGNFRGSVATIDTIITQEDIARLAGVTRESISLELNRSDRQRLIWKENQNTLIDVERLHIDEMPIVLSDNMPPSAQHV